MAAPQDVESRLLAKLTPPQKDAVTSEKRRLLVIAGAGSGKTEVMARRVAWWMAVNLVPREEIVAFTFTERAAEEMKFRIRLWAEQIAKAGEDVTLGDMYIGTIHGFCLKKLRQYWPDEFHNYDVLDEGARLALVHRGYYGVLGLPHLQEALQKGMHATIEYFLQGYDLLNEYDELDATLASPAPPHDHKEEPEWCKAAELRKPVGRSRIAQAFSLCAARYYAYLRSRRFLDFSTSQSELLRKFRADEAVLAELRKSSTHLVVDEVQDINPVQNKIVRSVVGKTGHLTAVGDHRQAIYGWRGGKVEIMGDLFGELKKVADGAVVELAENFRSTPRIIDVANRWAKSIGAVKTMTTPDMAHGNKGRNDFAPSHVSALAFESRQDEAQWIADTIRKLVRPDETGAAHDTRDGERGISLVDIAVLVRSTTDVRTYIETLESNGIPPVVRAGPDLFSRPEVLLFVAALAQAAGSGEFVGAAWDSKSLPNRIHNILGCDSCEPGLVLQAACRTLRKRGFPVTQDVERRLLSAAQLIRRKIGGEAPMTPSEAAGLKTRELIHWLSARNAPRRVFPQKLYHFLLGEAEVSEWGRIGTLGKTALFHLGQLSTLVTGVETPGWNSPRDFRHQISALWLWGTHKARTEEAPLLVPPNAVTVSTVHSAKGLEFPVVFLADVNSLRFPSSRAKVAPDVPFEDDFLKRIDPADLADNDNYDAERRLLYVALTRAERYLFVTHSGPKRSRFFDTVEENIKAAGGAKSALASAIPKDMRYLPSSHNRELRLVTSFSDLRYYLACPHDFYLRKVLGFSPPIDQAFGYGRGVHNLLRAIHSDPKAWAELVKDPPALRRRLEGLVRRGIFYLRYTTGEPLDNMRRHALDIVAKYVTDYAKQLGGLSFEPEREFETLIKEEQVLVSGAIDLIRLDEPPRVTLLDFKSGPPESESAAKLDEEEMRLQVSLYGLAAKREMEYEPEKGLVVYLDEDDEQKRELPVDLNEASLAKAHDTVARAAGQIRRREFEQGPTKKPRNPEHRTRCGECDFLMFCGMDSARKSRNSGRRPHVA